MSQTVSRRDWLVGGLTVLGGCAAAGVVSAAEGDKEEAAEEPKKLPPLRGQLSLEALANMLKALGLKTTKTESRFDFGFTAKHGEEWNLSMSVVLSTDERTIWIMAWLDELPASSADVPRTALLRLLSDNDKMGNGQFFAYVAANRRFVLQRVIKNEGVTSASFRNDLLELGSTVVNTHPHWAVTNWKQLGTAATPAKDAADKTVLESKPAAGKVGASPSKTAGKEASGAGKK